MGDERSTLGAGDSGCNRCRLEARLETSFVSSNSSLIGILLPLLLILDEDIWRNARPEAPGVPRVDNDLGVKKRVKVLGVIVGGFFGFVNCAES